MSYKTGDIVMYAERRYIVIGKDPHRPGAYWIVQEKDFEVNYPISLDIKYISKPPIEQGTKVRIADREYFFIGRSVLNPRHVVLERSYHSNAGYVNVYHEDSVQW